MVAARAVQKATSLLRRPNCAQMFFIYPGRGVGLQGRGEMFLSMMRNAGLSDRNLALVADPYADNFAQGVSPDIPDLPSLLDWHRNVVCALSQVSEVYHLGYSSGGYGAMLFGHLLGAKKVWAFAPRAARRDTAEAAKAFLKRQLLAGRGTTEHVIHYSPANGRDCAFAAYFADCPGVALSPYTMPPPDIDDSTEDDDSYYHRRLFRTVVDSGDLRRLLPPFRPAAESASAAVT